MQKIVAELVRIYKAQADLIVPLLLGCTSSCLGEGVQLRTRHPDPTYGLLYLLICTNPGVNNSTIVKWLQRPMLEYQKEARKKQRIGVESALASESKGNQPPAKKAIDAVMEMKGLDSNATPFVNGWFYLPNRGWLWTNRAFYPYFHDSTYFQSGNEKPWFYQYGAKEWMTVERDKIPPLTIGQYANRNRL